MRKGPHAMVGALRAGRTLALLDTSWVSAGVLLEVLVKFGSAEILEDLEVFPG